MWCHHVNFGERNSLNISFPYLLILHLLDALSLQWLNRIKCGLSFQTWCQNRLTCQPARVRLAERLDTNRIGYRLAGQASVRMDH